MADHVHQGGFAVAPSTPEDEKGLLARRTRQAIAEDALQEGAHVRVGHDVDQEFFEGRTMRALAVPDTQGAGDQIGALIGPEFAHRLDADGTALGRQQHRVFIQNIDTLGAVRRSR